MSEEGSLWYALAGNQCRLEPCRPTYPGPAPTTDVGVASTEAEIPTDGLMYFAGNRSCEIGIVCAGSSSTFKSNGVHVVNGIASECRTWKDRRAAGNVNLNFLVTIVLMSQWVSDSVWYRRDVVSEHWPWLWCNVSRKNADMECGKSDITCAMFLLTSNSYTSRPVGFPLMDE